MDQKIANVQAGGVPWQRKVLENQSLVANTEKVLNHDLDDENMDFDYTILVWAPTKQKYLKPQFSYVESNRTKDTITLLSSQNQSNFKVVFFG